MAGGGVKIGSISNQKDDRKQFLRTEDNSE